MYDYVIIGGGVVGASILNKLTQKGKKCLLLEKELDVATGATKANSALVHAGFDAMPKTLKAKLNVLGAKQFPSLCKRLKIPFKKIGALVVGNDLIHLNTLLERGKENGVKKLKIINHEKLHKLVPNLNNSINYALRAKTAGIVSPYLLTLALCEEAIINGAKVLRGFQIEKIISENSLFTILGQEKIETKKIINCAGAGFNEVAKLIGSKQYPLTLKRGQYFVLDNTQGDFVKTTIFPLPSEKGKGILATPTIDGNILFGPTSEIIDEYDTKTTKLGLDEIKTSISEMFTDPPFWSSIRQYSGIRVSCGQDFIIEEDTTQNGVINVVGINSPGLSSAPAIADLVLNLCCEKGKNIKLKRRTPCVDLSKLSPRKRNNFIRHNPEYGKIVCRCELVSEGEILNCLSSPLPPTTIDGVKRRVRAGMGRCQGSFCGLKVSTIISRFFNLSMTAICKENQNGRVMPYEIKQIGGEKR